MKTQLCLAAVALLAWSSCAVAQSGTKQDSGMKPVALQDGAAKISPENTTVEFVGVHVGGEPNPRLGGFGKFEGQLKVDGKQLKSMKIEFQIGSMWTEVGNNLTSHLKNADFFDVEKHPTASFVSTGTEPGKNGMTNIKGELTMMGETQPVTLPAKIQMNDAGVTIATEFKLDRSKFGMNKMLERVAKEVTVRLMVGKKFEAKTAAAGNNRRGGGRGRGMDPAAMFKSMDKDGNGKLSAEEMPERMRSMLGRMDKDGDEMVSQEELQEAMRALRGGRGGRGG